MSIRALEHRHLFIKHLGKLGHTSDSILTELPKLFGQTYRYLERDLKFRFRGRGGLGGIVYDSAKRRGFVWRSDVEVPRLQEG